MAMKPILKPEKTKFAQNNVKLTWVATESGFLQRATGVVSSLLTKIKSIMKSAFTDLKSPH